MSKIKFQFQSTKVFQTFPLLTFYPTSIELSSSTQLTSKNCKSRKTSDKVCSKDGWITNFIPTSVNQISEWSTYFESPISDWFLLWMAERLFLVSKSVLMYCEEWPSLVITPGSNTPILGPRYSTISSLDI